MKPSRGYLLLLILGAMVVKNVGEGAFTQIEQVILTDPDRRPVTTSLAIGWPFEILTSEEAFSRILVRSPHAATTLSLMLRASINLALIVVISLIASHELDRILEITHWRISTANILAAISVYGVLLAVEVQLFGERSKAGIASSALFRVVDAIVMLLLFLTFNRAISLGRRMPLDR